VEIDARPSDCIVLALLTKKPLYVAESVLTAVDDMSEVLHKILEQRD
jgi:bifunctional DNase/RNase